MGSKDENKVVNKFDADLKFIEEWIQKSIEQIDVSIKEAAGIKELKKAAVLDDECEENDMEVSENKEECSEIRFCYQEIWQKEIQE